MTTIFTKIIERKLPAEILYESDKVIAFRDINPQAPVHLLICSKKEISSIQALTEEDGPTLVEIFAVARQLAESEGVRDYRLLTNCGKEAGQTVFHLHFHLIGGRTLGAMA